MKQKSREDRQELSKHRRRSRSVIADLKLNRLISALVQLSLIRTPELLREQLCRRHQRFQHYMTLRPPHLPNKSIQRTTPRPKYQLTIPMSPKRDQKHQCIDRNHPSTGTYPITNNHYYHQKMLNKKSDVQPSSKSF